MARELSHWEPFRDMITLREAMDRLFEESFVRPSEQSAGGLPGSQLAVDIYEEKDHLVVKAAVPGIDPNDLTITVTGDVLTIKGETRQREEVKEEAYHRREFRYGSFCRSVRLPIETDSSRAEAAYKDGILTLTFPRPLAQQPKTIAVKVK